MQKAVLVSALVALAVLGSVSAGAQQATVPVGASDQMLKEAVQASVAKNPEVLARWHAFQEAAEEVGVARGGFLPKLDLSAGSGRVRTNQHRLGIDDSYHGNESSLVLRQMLFDGFATSNEVKRLGKAKLVRYLEFLDASETVALEAVRAYLDVVRYRSHVQLAEDNFVQHQLAYEQLRRRAESGVGRRVDVDQAASRLALADVNLTTALANLHDVSARFLSIVGDNAPGSLPLPSSGDTSFPEKVDAALEAALKHNPALLATFENIEAAQHQMEAQRAAFMPRFDIVARRDDFSNYEDNGSRDETRVELRMNYNLFNGGSDLARSRQYRERKNVALAQREKMCRDVRQTVSIAYNDTLRLKGQLANLAMQVSLVEKTRAAYRDQFNIGQRTLLDLLNTQNEYFDARRAQVNAEVDLALAYYRSHAGMGRLLEALNLKRHEAKNAPGNGEFAVGDAAELCPPFSPVDTLVDRERLVAKAKALAESSAGLGAVTVPRR
jgi:adhesin transport system outer membrane protein